MMLKEIDQAGRFYDSLTDEQKKDLTEAIAENIFFLDEDLQHRIIDLMSRISTELGEEIKQRNNFTI